MPSLLMWEPTFTSIIWCEFLSTLCQKSLYTSSIVRQLESLVALIQDFVEGYLQSCKLLLYLSFN